MFKLRLNLPTKTSLCLLKHMATRPERGQSESERESMTAGELDYVEYERGSCERVSRQEHKSESWERKMLPYKRTDHGTVDTKIINYK